MNKKINIVLIMMMVFSFLLKGETIINDIIFKYSDIVFYSALVIFLIKTIVLNIIKNIVKIKDRKYKISDFAKSSLYMFLISSIICGTGFMMGYGRKFSVVLFYVGLIYLFICLFFIIKKIEIIEKISFKNMMLFLAFLLSFSNVFSFNIYNTAGKAVTGIYEKYEEMSKSIFFPIQKAFAVSITGKQLTSRKEKFITEEQMNNHRDMLEPGDIIVRRNNWQLTNGGIPGFWTHSGLYLGSLEKLDNYFSGEEELEGKKFSEYIAEKFPEIYENYLDNNPEIIESIAKGVVLTPLNNMFISDYFAALRPKLTKNQKFKAIIKSFEFYGEPYDYSFDFNNSDELLCSEMLYNIYKNDINFRLRFVKGKIFYSPNDFIKQFAQERDGNGMNFVIYLKGSEKNKKAYSENQAELKRSWNYNKTELLFN